MLTLSFFIDLKFFTDTARDEIYYSQRSYITSAFCVLMLQAILLPTKNSPDWGTILLHIIIIVRKSRPHMWSALPAVGQIAETT